MAPPHLTQDTNAVLKLHLTGKDETRRIALRKLWNTDTANVSFQHLVDLAIQYSEVDHEKVSKVCITYIDEDGDTITISSDEELAEAFEQFVHQVPPVVRASAKVKQNKNANPYAPNANPYAPIHITHNVGLPVGLPPYFGGAPFLQQKQKGKMMPWMQQAKTPEWKTKLIKKKALERKRMLSSPPNESKQPVQEEKPRVVAEDPQPKAVPNQPNKVPLAPPTNETVPPVKVEPKLNRPKIPSSFNPNFIHGRHTCDGCFTSPIIGYRFNATNRPDYDLCQNCFKNYQGDAIRFLPEQLDRDVHLQQRWRNRQLRREKTKLRAGRAHGSRPVSRCPANPNPFDDMVGQKALDEAIRLSLITAKKAETEVQAPKEDKVEPKEEVTVEPAQAEPKVEAEPKVTAIPPAPERDESMKDIMQGMFEDPLQKPATTAAISVAKHFAELLKKHKAAKAAEAAVAAAASAVPTEEAVPDMKESATSEESVTSKPSPSEAKDTVTDEPEIEVAKNEVIVEDAPVEKVVVEDASVEEPEQKMKVPSTKTEITIEPIDTLVLEIEKPQVTEPSQVSEDDISCTSQRDDDISYSSQPGEVILDGDDADVAESQSHGASSNGDWQVVDNDGQNVTDAMMAQAAQMLGSALFESDANVAAPEDNHNASNSVMSGLTSVPSITTARSQISRVLLNRWEDELRQLHELGFLDDHANVEAFGHLEAANMGVGSDDVVTVEKVVNYLLNQ